MNVKLSPEEQKGVPYGDQVKQLTTIDWDVVNPTREEWNKRWTREIERWPEPRSGRKGSDALPGS